MYDNVFILVFRCSYPSRILPDISRYSAKEWEVNKKARLSTFAKIKGMRYFGISRALLDFNLHHYAE